MNFPTNGVIAEIIVQSSSMKLEVVSYNRVQSRKWEVILLLFKKYLLSARKRNNN